MYIWDVLYIGTFLYSVIILQYFIFKKLKPDNEKFINITYPSVIIGLLSVAGLLYATPHNYFSYLDNYLIMHSGIDITAMWPMSELSYQLIKNYLFTATFEEVFKFSSGFLLFIILNPGNKTYYKLFMYIVGGAAFFAFFENIQYFIRYGEDVIIIRLIYPTTLHISLGIISGFFIILAINKDKFIDTIKYATLGLLIVIFLHGSYNFTVYTRLMIISHFIWLFSVLLAMYSLFKVKKINVNKKI